MMILNKAWRCCAVAKFDLVIFDWDGTLIDSIEQIVRSIEIAAADLGVPSPSAEAARDIIGLGLPEAMRVLFPQVTEADRDSLRERYAHHFVGTVAHEVTPYSGIEPLLQDLHESPVALAVATGKSRRGLDRVLAKTGWADYFSATRCADETASKPDPRMLEELLTELQVPVERALMVGDTVYDLAMAEAIGMASVGVTYGVHSPQRLLQHNPRALCADALSLREFLMAHAAV